MGSGFVRPLSDDIQIVAPSILGARAALVASVWSAMVSVLLAVTFGLLLMIAAYPPADYVATWPEFQASGWTNARAFAIANTFDAVWAHLLVGPVAGSLFGGLGIGAARLNSARPRGRG